MDINPSSIIRSKRKMFMQGNVYILKASALDEEKKICLFPFSRPTVLKSPDQL